LLGGVLVAALGLLPTPYWIITPGNAVDLSRAVAVDGHAPGADRYLLTDVTVQRATALTIVMGLLPGARLVRQEALVPDGVPLGVYDRALMDGMGESQDVAAVVAERAAGLRVADPPHRLYVGSVLESADANRVLQAGDEIVSLRGRAITQPDDIPRLVSRLSAGTVVPITVRRGADVLALTVRTTQLGGQTKLGVAVETRTARPDLPVPVRFSVDNISGSSGGLMFALQIYAALHGEHRGAGTSIAGTGTIAPDGSVGPIEGTEQKLIAAKRAGASVFLVPKENAADIASERDVRVVPVGTFSDALRALRT
jgi:PDZ domain-containing protein